MGYATKPILLIIQELLLGSSLDQQLYVEQWAPDAKQTLKIAYDVAAGMDYLHTGASTSSCVVDGYIYPCTSLSARKVMWGGACCGFGCTAFEREGHDQPLIHRDLKSPNLLLAEVPGPGTEVLVKITDFGLSKDKSFDNAKQTAMMTGCGSVLWMAPEILTGETYRQNSESIYL
jgi:serine/threonine protein kinase